MLRRVAGQRSSFVEVPHPAMFGNRWRVNSFARFSGGVTIFGRCGIRWVPSHVPTVRSVAMASGGSHSCIVSLDRPLALPAGIKTTANQPRRSGKSTRFGMLASKARAATRPISPTEVSRLHGSAGGKQVRHLNADVALQSIHGRVFGRITPLLEHDAFDGCGFRSRRPE